MKSLRPPKEKYAEGESERPLIRHITLACPFCRVSIIHEQLGEGPAETHLSAAAKVEALSRDCQQPRQRARLDPVLRAVVPGLGDAAVPADAAGGPGMAVTDPDRHVKDPQHADYGG